MSKLGESRLGSTQFSKPEPFEPDAEPARERAEEHIKSAFPTHEGTTWDKVLNMILFEFELEAEIVESIISGRFINDATMYQLDMIGDYFGLDRRPDEDDGQFRARIKSQLPRHTTQTTINDIVRVSAQMLDTHPSRITVSENFDIEPARFDVFVEEIVWHEADIDVAVFETLLQDMKAGGVRVQATLGDQFTHRSVSDWEDGVNDEDKAYGGYDHQTIHWPEDEDDTLVGDYGEDTYGDGTYYGGVYTHNQHGQVTEDSVLLDVGGPYADEITAGFN